MTNTYRIADTGIRITSGNPSVHRFCKDYLAPDAEVDLSIAVNDQDIALEREMIVENDVFVGVPVRELTDAHMEMLAIHRKISEAMPFRNTFLMHGSCIAVDGAAYLFTAKSGTGKSTHTALWRERFLDRAVMVNDDKPLIAITDKGVIAYGSPWCGKHRLSTNTSVPLKSICILERAEQNRIKEISFAEAYPMLIQQIYRPLHTEAMMKTLQLIDRLPAYIRFWRLGCNMEPEAAEVSYEAMKG